MNYATKSDVIKYRPGLDTETIEHIANDIIPAASATLRLYAKNAGFNLDEAFSDNEDIQLVVAKAVVDSCVSYCDASKSHEPLMSQFSQAIGGYSVSGSYANIGNGFYFPKSALQTIGIKKQKIGTFEVFKYDGHC